MKKITVLGAGMVGSAIAADLCMDYQVTSVDINSNHLKRLSDSYPVRTLQADLRDPSKIKEVINNADLVIGAVPGFLGFETVKTVITSGKNIVDISFFPEDAFILDEAARENGVTACVDCGVAPGMSNFILGYHNKRMDVKKFEFYVGGLPVVRQYPYQYKAPFSPVDVIEEYIRPARLVENGRIVTKEALSDREYMFFEHVGTLEAFNTDGLRTLLKTMSIPDMKEKTLRYPGHIDIIRLLKESGFFATEPVLIRDVLIRPIDFTSKILFPLWELKSDTEEFTIMRIIIEGIEDGRSRKYIYDLFDRYDKQTHTSSMSRTTGYAATAIANLVLKGMLNRKGIVPPEFIGEDETMFYFVMDYLKKRKVEYRKTEF